ncbi:MAG: TetR/AcrR family transcriptional regulator [Clostridia bacterium]|nr:TetR/AcrR family transcriptional regulator [Clostridia bacterium]
MAELRKSKLIKHEIIKTATALFLEGGYSKTSPQMIAKELGISTGNLTYHYPTKEHLLAVLVEMLCEFQEKLIGYEADKGLGPAMSICIELMTVAAACEENEAARDFFVSTFQSSMCLDYLRKSHVERAKRIFAEQCKDWTDEQFIEAEILVHGIDYATIISSNALLPLDVRIAGALNQILNIYNVPEEIRREKIERVLSMDCHGLGERVLKEFISYVENTIDDAFDEMINNRKKKD